LFLADTAGKERTMAKPRSMKRDVDKAKKERAAMKRERRQRPAADKVENPDDVTASQPPRPVVPPEEVIARLGELHVRFEAEEIDFVEYEQVKGELVALLTTD
jgi:hypothetical protein